MKKIIRSAANKARSAIGSKTQDLLTALALATGTGVAEAQEKSAADPVKKAAKDDAGKQKVKVAKKAKAEAKSAAKSDPLAEEKAAAQKAAAERKAAADKLAAQKQAADKVVADKKAATDKKVPEKLATEKAATERAAPEKAPASKAVAETKSPEKMVEAKPAAASAPAKSADAALTQKAAPVAESVAADSAAGAFTLGSLSAMQIGLIGAGVVGVAALASNKDDDAPAGIKSNVKAVDGYVRNADAFLDLDGDRVQDTNEPAGRTNTQGDVVWDGVNAIPGTLPAGAKVVIKAGGTDTITGQVVGQMVGDATIENGAITVVVSPFTTLIASGAITEAQLRERLQIPESVDLSTYDPVQAMASAAPGSTAAATATQVFAAAQQLSTVIQAASVDAGGSTSNVASAAASIAASIAAQPVPTQTTSGGGDAGMTVIVAAATQVLSTASSAQVVTQLSSQTVADFSPLQQAIQSASTGGQVVTDSAAIQNLQVVRDLAVAQDDLLDIVQTVSPVAPPLTLSMSFAEAQVMIARGVEFAADDTITVVSGTTLNNNDKVALKNLGVDTLDDAAPGTIDLNSFTAKLGAPAELLVSSSGDGELTLTQILDALDSGDALDEMPTITLAASSSVSLSDGELVSLLKANALAAEAGAEVAVDSELSVDDLLALFADAQGNLPDADAIVAADVTLELHGADAGAISTTQAEQLKLLGIDVVEDDIGNIKTL